MADGLKQLHKETGEQHRGDRHRDETAHNHRREEPAHQIVHFILGRPFIVADLFSHDGIERESVESRQAVGKAKVGRDAQNAADNCGYDAHTNQTYDDQRKHRSNQVKEHGRRAVGQARVHEHDQSEEKEVLRPRMGEHIRFKKTEAAKDDAHHQCPDGPVDRREHAKHEGDPTDNRELQEDEKRRIPGGWRGEQACACAAVGQRNRFSHNLSGVLAGPFNSAFSIVLSKR